MTELYTNMRYLQYGTLQKLGLGHFDSWASSFGETQTAIELAPKGDGTFNVYEDIKNKLVGKGVPENEIAFIHDANTETRKAEL